MDESMALAKRIRLHVLEMTHQAKSSHVGSCFSVAEILAVLFQSVLRVHPEDTRWPERDRFILSKGHAAAAFYAVLAEKGFFPLSWLDSFYQNGSRLAGHASHCDVPGVEVSTGSLGHGLSIATGMALAAKLDEKSFRVFALLSDGECDEGSTWEAILFASQHHLDNLVAIVDYNKIQSMGRTQEIIGLEPFAQKWASCGWAVREIYGHDCAAIESALSMTPWFAGQPNCLIAHTVKGKGVSFMENQVLWHYRTAQGEEYEQALAELERIA